MTTRNGWIQREVVDMGIWLGLKNFDRRSVKYWQDQGIFPEPKRTVKGVMSFYKNDDKLNKAFIEIGQRVRGVTKITYEDVEMAKIAVNEKNKKEVQKLFSVIRE